MRRFLAPILIALAVVALFAGIGVWAFSGVFSAQSGDSAESGSRSENGPRPCFDNCEDDEDFGEVAVYDVLADGTLDPQAEGVAAEVWDLWVRLIGAETAGQSIIQFRAGDAPDSDTLAYVYQDEDPQYFTLGINLATADDPQLLVSTLVHEYAHVFSFAPGEFDAEASSCDTIALVEGCASGDSYLWAFYEEFWSGYAEQPDLENVDADIAYEFYLANEEDFVSDYAATNFSEDFAESFMTFVIEEDWSADSPTGAKLEFFMGYPELVELREQMRAGAARELGLG